MGFYTALLGPFEALPALVGSSIATVIASHSWSCGYHKLSAGVALWVITAYYIAKSDAFVSNPSHWQPTDYGLAYGAVCSIPFVVYILTWGSGLKEYLVHVVPSWGLIALNFFRVIGGMYFYLYYSGERTDLQTLQVGVLDMFIAITAIPLALFVARNGLQKCKRIVMAWNLIGVWDLVETFVAFSLNVVGIYKPELDLCMFGIYPLSMIVLFQVPVFMLIHFTFLFFFDQMGASREPKKIN